MSEHKSHKKQPWPTLAVMKQIYDKKLWGGTNFDFYSGDGSHHPSLVLPYIHAVSEFLTSFKQPLSICDLGCGDFNIGKQLVPYAKAYHAVDIVPELIARNKAQFQHPSVTFYCLDIAKDALPQADCVILRQVLQHLSNSEVQCIVDKLANYAYVIVTEHIPEGDFVPNKDIISGQGIRLKVKSGVDLLAHPFKMNVAEAQILVAVSLPHKKGKIVTTLYRNHA